MDWTEVFGLSGGFGTTIPVSEVPRLAEAVREVSRRAMDDDELMRGVSRLAPLMDGKTREERREQVEFETAARLVGKILNRADAIDAETDEELRSIYQQIERARFSKKLTGDVIVPLVAVSFDTDEPVHIDSNAWIEQMTEADHRARALQWMRQDNVSPYVAAAATHAVVLRDVQFTNVVHSWPPGQLPSEISDDIARAVAEAVYIVAEVPSGHAQILIRPRDWATEWRLDLPPLWSAWTGRAYPEDLMTDRAWNKARIPIPKAEIDEIVQIAKALKTAPKNVLIAARRCRRTSFRDDPEDIVLDVAIGIEALVGKEKDALTHRMAQRAAVALADRIPPGDTYSLVKQFYGIRSSIAHGVSPKNWTLKLGNDQFGAVDAGRFILRYLLRSLLSTDKPWDAASLDARMLERLEPPEGYPSTEPDEE
ncbi:HEPN domain-containing protein [Rhodococcus sp. USK13]|uniref:HEPN domain-containing protein n=1 Tax=Rhodococcus sp. USK13 TaxID=2806442 RepID=UPI001BCD54BE|nr:HEPN domain-containing protein [Rhodococcus sp. USK13]